MMSNEAQNIDSNEQQGFFKRLVTQSGIYAIGSMLIKASGILLAPIYLNPEHLLEVEFGTFSLLEVTGQISILAIGLGLHVSLMKYMSDDSWEGRQEVVPFTVLLTVVGSAVVFCSLLYVLAPVVASTILGDIDRTEIFRLYLIYIGLKATLVIPYTLLRFKERAGLYVIASVAEIAVLVGAIYFLVVQNGMGLEGVVWGFIVSTFTTALILVPASLIGVKWGFDRSVAGQLLRYGVPLAVGGLAVPILHAGDRYLVEMFIDTETVAVYTWGSRISGILNMLFVQSFNLAFMVVGLKTLGSDKHDYSLHKRTLRHYAAGAAWCALALALLAEEITRLLGADAGYFAAVPLVYPLSLGYFFYGIYLILVNSLFAGSRTKTIGGLVVAAAVGNILMNMILIPSIGIWGAAVSTLLSYAGLALLANIYAQRVAVVRYDWGLVARCLAVSLLIYLLSVQIGSESLGMDILLIILYAPVLLLLRVYSIDELKNGLHALRKFLGRT